MNKNILAIGFAFFIAAGNALSQDTKRMHDKLNKLYPNLGVQEVEYIKDLKLYELKLANNHIPAYTNEDIDFFLISGELIDPKNKVNYTHEREFAKVKKFFNSLPKEQAIVVKYGKGTRKLAIFSDPDCPFCKSLDKEIHTKLHNKDITIYYYMNPLNIPGHEQAPLKAAKIWCSKDRAKAWIDWMLNGVLPDNNGTCKNPVAATKKFASEVGFNSTPIIIFDNGYTSTQAISAEQIMRAFNLRNP